MKHYTATAAREGKWWIVRIPELDGVTQTRRLDDAESMARDFIAVTLDVPAEQIDVHVRVDTVGGVDVQEVLQSISIDRSKAATLERDASERAATLAKRLHAAEIPVRDIGAIMGVSFQRAHQLVKS